MHNVKRTVLTAFGEKKRCLDAAQNTRIPQALREFVPSEYSTDIVKASQQQSQHTLVADSVIEKFTALSEQSYTVTTLFCLFQGKRIVNSFEFLNMQGASELGSTKATEAANLISSYFKALSANPKSASTPNNPFVLGYGLTQKLEEIPAKDRKQAENVPYFIPRQFDLTVTKGDGEYSNGVINYCLLTHRPDEDPNRSVGEGLRSIDYEKDVGAGFWDAGNTPYKRIRADGKASGADGVMTFSREIFRDYWLSENFLSYFKVNMDALGRDLVPQDDNVASAQPTATYNEYISKGYQDQVNKLCLTQEYKFQPMTCQDMDTDKMKESEDLSAFLSLVLIASKKINLELKYLQRRQAQGFAEAILTYTSDVQKNPNLGKSADTNRKIYFDVAMRSLLSITQEASGICNINRLFEDKKRVAMWTLTAGIGLAAEMIANPQWFIDIFTQWRAARRANIQIVTKVGFDMSPAGDTWSLALEKDKSRTTVPIGSEELPKQVNPPVSFTTLENIIGEQKMTDLSKRMKGDGVIIDLENHDMFKEFGTSKGMDRFAKPANQWASNFESRMESNMAALASSLMTKLILPAGNVFEFKSLNTDDEGHVYSLISYKTPTDVSKL
ncbi:uncharacterized protein NECHADRAFT_55608 [Fusarium vanettenii 77-13-4]|uniref:Uncharacterized protein n=1 Tax=Fusarium vanettenii (strain ATCC MYA-4622 / CBS 123669 / FGSC 9596 / NRRL 45880 / 77-13-4) TaxID=660122 RepID=C7ZQ16_FUSV7|nr:uncharacterized protein NECHADRAFT_55608 [Fusarium vanettenii 77-13-4]EEU33900.1 hypothetical protein NECHADRAFT_55608 [Fusarium vanettenii 77-13-4]